MSNVLINQGPNAPHRRELTFIIIYSDVRRLSDPRGSGGSLILGLSNYNPKP